MSTRVGVPRLVAPLVGLLGAAAGAQVPGAPAPHAAARDTATRDSATRHAAVRDTSARHAPARLSPVVVVAGRLTRPAGGAGAAARVDEAGPDARTAARPPVGGPAPAAALLARLPGVSSFDDQGTRAQPTLDVRGFTLSPVVGVGQGVSVFLDGVRVNEADAQEVNFDLLPAEAVRGAELVRGPSALYGKNTLGGALVLTTRRGGDGGPALDAGADAGAFGQRGVRFAASGARPLGAPAVGGAAVDGYVLARSSREDGWRDATAARRQLLFATGGRRDASGDVALSVLAARDSLGQAGSLPESWLAAGGDAARRANYTPGDWYAPTTLEVALRGRRRVGAPDASASEVRGTLFVRDTRSGQFNVNADAPSTLARVVAASAGGTVEGERRTRLLGTPLVAIVGGEVSRDAVRYRVFERASGPSRSAQPDDACAPAASSGGDALCEDATANALNGAAFAQGVLAPGGRVSLVASLRADWVRVPFVDRQTPANSGTSAFRQLSPRVGVTVTPAPAWRAYATVGTGFRAPAAVELACADPSSPCPLPFSLGDDPPLRPVRVRNAEAGADWTPAPLVAFTASAFRADVRDEILLVASERTAGYFTNFPRTRRAGLELTARAGPAPGGRAGGVSAFASWALVRATYEADGLLASARATPDSVHPGDRLPLTPETRATAGVRAEGRAGGVALGAELSASAVGPQRMRGDEGGAGAPLPGYALTALGLSAARGRVRADVSVCNLFDRRYVTFGTWAPNALAPDRQRLVGGERVERFLTPGYPRAVAIGVSVAR